MTLEPLLSDVVPDAAERDRTQHQYGRAALNGPLHSRLLESLGEENLASGFGDSASDGQFPAATRYIIHFASPLSQKVVGTVVDFLRSHQSPDR